MRDKRIFEAEMVDGHEIFAVACDCGNVFTVEDYEYELEPWPHITCSNCGDWISLDRFAGEKENGLS